MYVPCFIWFPQSHFLYVTTPPPPPSLLGLIVVEASRSYPDTLGRTPLDEWSARRKDLYSPTNNHDIHAPDGIRTRNPSKRATADPRLTARLHGSPRLNSTVESMKLNSTVERYCLHTERRDRFQNGGKWTCVRAGVCCDMWLFKLLEPELFFKI